MSGINLITDNATIALVAEERTEENDAFRSYLKKIDSECLDKQVSAINDEVTPQIDCTACGACCRSLMINVEEAEILPVAESLAMSAELFKENFIEHSLQGQMIINTIPCHFLSENKCTVYKDRFSECREFPHLHKSNFKGRLFGTLMHYARCPIIFNVVEKLKYSTGFKS